MSKQQSILNLVQQQTTTLLPNMAQKLTHLQRLNELWQKYIDMQLTKHTRVANWRDGRLIIEIDSASWATDIRYSLPELLRKLKTEKELADLKFIEWYIQPQEAAAQKSTSRKPAPLSTENSQLLIEAATHTPNEKLKRALLALANHTADSRKL